MRFIRILPCLLLLACAQNRAPVVSNITVSPTVTSQGVAPCQPLRLEVKASDPDNDPLIVSFEASPSVGLLSQETPSSTTAYFAFNPSPAQATTVSFRATVTDGKLTTQASGPTVTFAAGPGEPCGRITGVVRPGVRFFSTHPDLPETAELVADEAIVRLKPGLRPQSMGLEFVREVGEGAGIVRRSGLRTQSAMEARVTVGSAAGQATLEWIDGLQARSDVESAEPNFIVRLQATPTDPLYTASGPNQRWHYEQFGLPAAWDQTTGSSDITVAVIDSGILYKIGDATRQHPDFNCEVATGVSKIAPGYDFLENDADPYDTDAATEFHGTHVAGTVGACANNGVGGTGVAWGARILPVRALNSRGGTLEDIARAIYWAAGVPVPGTLPPAVPVNPNPAKVINMSLGGQLPPSRIVQDAINAALGKGAVIVVAAGNDNVDASKFLPANQQGVIVVGATGPNKARAYYSNHGPAVSVMAPGGDQAYRHKDEDGVLSSAGCGANGDKGGSLPPCVPASPFGYAFFQGTSMAAPHVSGLVALMMSVQPGLRNPTSPASVWVRVLSYLRDASSLNGLTLCERGCGAGLVNASTAISNAVAFPATGPQLVQVPDTTVIGSAVGPVNLGSSATKAKIIVQNVGDRDAGITFDTVGSPGLRAATIVPNVATGAKNTINVILDRSKVPNGSYGGRLVINYGAVGGAPYRKLEVRVYYTQGTPGALSDTNNVRVRLYRRDYTCVNDQQRLNFPGLPVNADGSFAFDKLEPDTYDVLAYRAVQETPDGTLVSEMGRLDNVTVNAKTIMDGKDLTLEPVNTIIGPEQPANTRCQPK